MQGQTIKEKIKFISFPVHEEHRLMGFYFSVFSLSGTDKTAERIPSILRRWDQPYFNCPASSLPQMSSVKWGSENSGWLLRPPPPDYVCECTRGWLWQKSKWTGNRLLHPTLGEMTQSLWKQIRWMHFWLKTGSLRCRVMEVEVIDSDSSGYC